MMSKYNPAQVREQLLHAVGKLLLAQGIAELSLQKVAQEAGVSKGALFHHFANKDALLSAFFANLLADFERGILRHLAPNPTYADFLYAYTKASFEDLTVSHDSVIWVMQFLSYQDYKLRWQDWLNRTMPAFETRNSSLNLLKCAVDGLWLNLAIGVVQVDEVRAIQAFILQQIEQYRGIAP